MCLQVSRGGFVRSLIESGFPSVYNLLLSSKALSVDRLYRKKIALNIDKIQAEPSLPLFTQLEIETINRCNNSCAFCPVNRLDDRRPYRLMDERLFMSIVSQLKELHYSGKVGLYSNNEPLLDSRILRFHEILRDALPNAYLYLYTNGTLLTIDRFKSLMSVLDMLIIDNYKDDLTLLPPVEKIYRYIKIHREYEGRVLICVLRRSAMRLTRGGQVKNRRNLFPLRSPCILPFYQMVIRPDGKLSLCCCDALGEFSLGDLTKTSILDAWTGQPYREIRKVMARGRHHSLFCRNCDLIVPKAEGQQ